MSHSLAKKTDNSTNYRKYEPWLKTTTMIMIFGFSLTGFFTGQIYGYYAGLDEFSQQCFGERQLKRKSNSLPDDQIIEEVDRRVKEDLIKTIQAKDDEMKIPSIFLAFDDKTKEFARGLARIDKDEFVEVVDLGYPIISEHSDAMIVYNYETAKPKRYAEVASNGEPVPKLSVNEGLENCEAVNIVMTSNPGNLGQCLVIVGQNESYHVQRWLRVDPQNGGKVNHRFDLTPVSRGLASSGQSNFNVPQDTSLNKHWDFLGKYFKNLDEVLRDLKEITGRIQKHNTIIVLTCNFGQSELLLNFACSARARGLDTSNVLVFVTDSETKELAESVGLTAYYNEYYFAKVPKQGAKEYGDAFFTAMMITKVICVQLISLLGYDVLFQDVDIVWYRNPMGYFIDLDDEKFDIYFQHDGSTQLRFAPLSANSGFYFVRNNERTRYFFSVLLLQSDVIIQSTTHQQVLVSLLNEHISLFNLRVKIMPREKFDFLGGFHYHQRGNILKQFFEGKLVAKPYLFHMSWTRNKDNKLKFFQQMGDWFLHEQCIAKEKKDILAALNKSPKEELEFVQQCCLTEPNITCWYRDKPSKIPCRHAQAIDGRQSFW